MKMHKILHGCLWTAAIVAASALTGCDKKPTSTAGTGIARVACDKTFENILQQEIEVYEYQYPKANIMPFYVDEKAALDSLLNVGDVKTIVIPRKLSEKELKYMESKGRHVRQQMIAVDAVALITNPSNKFNEPVSRRDLARILSGEITKWSEMGPSNAGKIKVVFEHQGSSTVKYMQDSIMNGAKFAPNVYVVKTPEEVFAAVKEDPNALGVIGVSWISSDLNVREFNTAELYDHINKASDQDHPFEIDQMFSDSINVLAVRPDDSPLARKPYQAYIYDGTYPMYRQMWMITTAPGGSLASGFYAFVTGPLGQKLIQSTGILPAIMHKRRASLD